MATSGPFAERLQVAWSTLDGGYFYRLWTTGGRYEHLFEVPDVPVGLFGFAVLGSLLLLAAIAWRAPRCLPSPKLIAWRF